MIQILYNNRPLIKSTEEKEETIRVSTNEISNNHNGTVLEFNFDEATMHFIAHQMLLKNGFLSFLPDYYETLSLVLMRISAG